MRSEGGVGSRYMQADRNLAVVASGRWERSCGCELVGPTPNGRDRWSSSTIRETCQLTVQVGRVSCKWAGFHTSEQGFMQVGRASYKWAGFHASGQGFMQVGRVSCSDVIPVLRP